MLRKLFFKPIGLFLKLYWRIVQPFTIGVRAIIINDKNQVLLVKHTYCDLWYFPGGGVDKREALIPAIKRELKEELNLNVKDKPILLATYSNFFGYKSDFVSIFIIKKFDLAPEPNLEIEDWAFFDLNNIPSTTSRGTKKRLAEHFDHQEIDYLW